MNKLIYFLLFGITIGLLSCDPKINYCENPEVNELLKNAMVEDLKGWQRNADYAGIENFEEKVNRVIEELEVVDNWYKGTNDYEISQIYLENNYDGASSCLCSSKMRFRDHDEYKSRIEGPVAKVKAEEHHRNSAYIAMEDKMNYLDNDGYVFSYVVIKKENEPVKVIEYYPIPTQHNLDDAGGLIFDYVEHLDED